MNFSHIYCHEPYSVRDEETAIIRYFKLHGSFNWGFCPESKETFMYYPGPNLCAYKEFHYGKEQCHGGKHCVRPLLIPPKMEKNIEIPGLREIWRKARYFLEGTQEVHILGYSLPRADEGAKQLLSTTLNRPLKRLIIANPDKNHRERLRGILSSDIVDYREYESFEDYLNKQSGIKFN